MPAITTLSMTDGTDTITLEPRSMTNGKTVYVSKVASSRAAELEVVFSNKDNNGVNRQYLKMDSPYTVLDTDTNEEIVKEHIIIELNVRCPEIVPYEERTKIMNMFTNLQASASGVKTELTTGQGQY